jgi:SPP1 family predicted phage head-tail adaptor
MPTALINAGDLDKRVTLRARTDSQGTAGGMVFSFSVFATVWAAIEPARAFKTFGGAQQQESHDTLIKIRYLPGVRSTMIVGYVTPESDTKFYEITGVRLDRESRRGYLYLQCVEKQGDGWWK